MSEPQIRPRREDDLPALGEALLEQQAASGYPHRDPLPMPPEDFIVRGTELAAWVGEIDGAAVGHVAALSVREPDDPSLDPGDVDLVRAWMCGHDRPAAGLGEVGVFFTATAARGHGIGSALLDVAVAALRERGLAPCLDVLPTSASAVRLYAATGWVEVGRARPSWLGQDDPDVLAMALPFADPALRRGYLTREPRPVRVPRRWSSDGGGAAWSRTPRSIRGRGGARPMG